MNPTHFSQILGNEEIKRRLTLMLERETIGHALLFAGADGIGKSLFAWALAAQLMKSESHSRKIQCGQHPDIHILRPEGKLGLHSIQAMRQLCEDVYLPPFEASCKVFILHDADRMLSTSANALLKTFEEPPPQTVIILISRSLSSLIPTILSRCNIFHFQTLPTPTVKEYLQQHFPLKVHLAARAQGSIGRAIQLTFQEGQRLALLNLLNHPIFNYRLFREEVQKITEQAEKVKKEAENNAKGEIDQILKENYTAQYRHLLEKELEGKTALALIQEAIALFEVILSWARDLHLLAIGGAPSLLENPDFHSALEQHVQRGELHPLETIHQAVEEAYLALQRSTPLSLCLETLLLKLL